MIDPRKGFIYQTGDLPRGGNASGVSFHFGLTHTYKKLKLGASIRNLTNPNGSVLKQFSNAFPPSYNFNASYLFKTRDFDIIPIYNITWIEQFTSEEFSLMIQYRKKYYVNFGYQLKPKQYRSEAGVLLNNKLYISASHSVVPRFLDYVHTLSFRIAYLFKPVLIK